MYIKQIYVQIQIIKEKRKHTSVCNKKEKQKTQSIIKSYSRSYKIRLLFKVQFSTFINTILITGTQNWLYYQLSMRLFFEDFSYAKEKKLIVYV